MTLLEPAPTASTGDRRPMIVASDAHVTYKVYSSGKPVGARAKTLGQRGGVIDSVHAVRGISFTASEGESVGVIGHNGSGKSTLFRALAGLIPTSAGHVWAADRPVLLGVNAALMPELSGESNIKLGLLAMGFTPAEAAAQVDEIADFAELNEFISHPMRTYSSGMGARLRFAIASARPHSILLLDEALAVGDRRFRLKSEARIRQLRDAAGLVMIVSHSAGSLKETCERTLWVHKGELRADGPTRDVVAEYTRWTKDPTSVGVGAASKPKPQAKKPAASTAATSTSAARSAATEASPQQRPTSTTPIPVIDDRPRARARRDRFHDTTRKRSRRKLIATMTTAGAIIVAVGAGAAIALTTNQAERTELQDLRTIVEEASLAPTRSPSPTDTGAPDAALPVINSFTAPTSVQCADVASLPATQLAWDVAGATSIKVTIPAFDGSTRPVLDGLPGGSGSQTVAFDCYSSVLTYDLTATNATGQSISASVTVVRELAPTSEAPAPQPVPSEAAPEPALPTTDPEPSPSEEPSVDPLPPEEPSPPAEPTPEEPAGETVEGTDAG